MLLGLIQSYSATQPQQSQVGAGQTGASTQSHWLRAGRLSSIHFSTSSA